MDKVVVLFTMEGCPFCVDLKKMLNTENVNYLERDIDVYEEEYNLFVEATGNDFIPAFMLIKNPETDNPITELYAPDRDFSDITEGFNIIKGFLK
jgi:glutaredoxin